MAILSSAELPIQEATVELIRCHFRTSWCGS
jgi:hypothetical protein